MESSSSFNVGAVSGLLFTPRSGALIVGRPSPQEGVGCFTGSGSRSQWSVWPPASGLEDKVGLQGHRLLRAEGAGDQTPLCGHHPLVGSAWCPEAGGIESGLRAPPSGRAS